MECSYVAISFEVNSDSYLQWLTMETCKPELLDALNGR